MSRGTPLAVIGPGRAGLALARLLARRGFPLTGIVARTRASARRASRLSGRGAGTLDLAGAVAPARVILLCVPDSEIPAAAGALGSLPSPGVRSKTILHTSGAFSCAVLEPARRAGAAVGSLHPLVSFPEPGAAPPDLRGVAFGVDGDPRALRVARALARRLGGVPIAIPAQARGAWHLAASLTAPGLVALLDAGIDLARRRTGIPERRAREAFLALAASVLRNLARVGPRRAMTGPVVRGDERTVARHLQELAGEDPALESLYRLLSLRALAIARAGGRLDPDRAGEIERLLLRH
ncbi:MAG TPA: DUF2520 domain-containing protein [Candidatus Polarisedimenticolia bacterium]|jgi:predicted short-subunit dehydrogenase-like oxidoreductase (DUF2520 family)